MSDLPPLPEPAGFTAGDHDGALFSTKRSTGKNFSRGSGMPLCEWYSADQVRAAVAAERDRCAKVAESRRRSWPMDGPATADTIAAAIRREPT